MVENIGCKDRDRYGVGAVRAAASSKHTAASSATALDHYWSSAASRPAAAWQSSAGATAAAPVTGATTALPRSAILLPDCLHIRRGAAKAERLAYAQVK